MLERELSRRKLQSPLSPERLNRLLSQMFVVGSCSAKRPVKGSTSRQLVEETEAAKILGWLMVLIAR